jgi:hypothetical protein
MNEILLSSSLTTIFFNCMVPIFFCVHFPWLFDRQFPSWMDRKKGDKFCDTPILLILCPWVVQEEPNVRVPLHSEYTEWNQRTDHCNNCRCWKQHVTLRLERDELWHSVCGILHLTTSEWGHQRSCFSWWIKYLYCERHPYIYFRS